MLNKLRNTSKNSFVKITLGSLLTVLILSFAMWGTEDLIGATNKQNTVASVGNINISNQEFMSLYTRQTEEIRKLLGASLNIEKGRQFGYVDRALSALINRALFNNQASELGLSVSNLNVRDKIVKDQAFKDDLDQFSELLFRQLISESGYTEDTYVEGTRQDLAREQMVDTIRSSLILPDVMKKNFTEYNMQERSVNYVTISPKNFDSGDVSESELSEFYNNNKELFLTEEFRTVDTILLDAKKYAENIIVTEDEIKLLYEERKENLIKPERRFLKQILIQDEKIAKEFSKKISKDNFEKIAVDNFGQKEEDINLGWNTKDELPEEIVTDVFKLNKNQISSPIKSAFGYHIIIVLDIDEREELTFDQVEKSIKNELLLEKGKDAVYELQDDVEDLLASGDSLREISEKLELNFIHADAIDKNGNNQDGTKNNFFQDTRILRAIFNQKENEEGNLIDIDEDQGLAVSIVEKIIPSKQMNFSESKNLVYERVVENKKFAEASNFADMIKSELDKEKTFEKLAKKHKLDLRGVSPFNRIKPDDSELPLQLISEIFKKSEKEVVVFKSGTSEIFVAQVANISKNKNFDNKEIKSFIKRIEDDMSIDLLAQFSEILRKKYKISINDDVIDQLN
tara:strand:- start:48374 stop:50260 length:1887 start_codon:yes stop_codon:yes gene_type:complete